MEGGIKGEKKREKTKIMIKKDYITGGNMGIKARKSMDRIRYG